MVLPEIRELELVFRTPGQLVPGAFGVPTPTGEEREASDIDVVLVPAVGVGPKGERLGQGGGYYDRFLQRTEALRIAVVFEGQCVEHIPVEPHDARVDAVVTERGIRWF